MATSCRRTWTGGPARTPYQSGQPFLMYIVPLKVLGIHAQMLLYLPRLVTVCHRAALPLPAL